MRLDTIVAPATPAGVSGLAVIRISGPDTLLVLRRLGVKFEKKNCNHPILKLIWLKDEKGELIDQVMTVVFFKPRSYTGEDMAEISCHGSPLIIDRIVGLCQRYGCRIAQPGEFTRRAVQNGKLTISQAEALGYLVSARTPQAHRQLITAYHGATGRFVATLAERVRNLYSWCEYLLGFDEEEKSNDSQLNRETKKIILQINRALTRAENNRFLFEPDRVTIIGRPNVGKSSLFNRLLEEERAITSPIPGTTRDYIDATITIRGVVARLIDTCGFDPKTKNPLTRLGTQKTETALNHSDFLLVVFDGSQPAQPQDRAILALTKNFPKIYIINKSDLNRHLERDFLPGPTFAISCKTGVGINRVRTALARHLHSDRTNLSCPIISRRQIDTLKTCRDQLYASLNSPDLETRSIEIKHALEELNQIDQPFTSEEVLNRVFENFCIGK
ncbi:MAG: tRNA uridine-5-carboxymethylaminomethyl(34) synthesis GTPase MnmE [bacterium]